MNSQLKICAVFAFLGPVIGGVIGVVTSNFQEAVRFSFQSSSEIAVLITLVIFYPKALAIGFVPASLTGCAYALLISRSKLKQASRPLQTLVAGVLGGALTTVYHGLVLPLVLPEAMSSKPLLLGLYGALAAVVCAVCATFIRPTKAQLSKSQ